MELEMSKLGPGVAHELTASQAHRSCTSTSTFHHGLSCRLPGNSLKESKTCSQESPQTLDRPDAQLLDGSMMLLPILQDRPVLFLRETSRVIRRASTPVMNRFRSWKEADLPAPIPAALAPIHIFGINEKIFIQQPDFSESFFSYHPETAHQDIYIQFAVVSEVVHVLVGEHIAVLENFG
jgi:hypothetical protein